MKTIEGSAVSLKGAMVAISQKAGPAGAPAAQVDGDTIKPAANEALAVTLLPGTDDAAQQQQGGVHDLFGGDLLGGRGGRREVDTDTTPDDDGTSGMRDWGSMLADDGGGKSYGAPWNDPDGGKAGYKSWPNGDGTFSEVYPDGSGDDGICLDEPATDEPEEDEPKEDPPKDDKPKEDPPKDDKPKEDPPKEDPPKEDPPKEDTTDNTPPDGCTPGTVPACGGDEDYAPIPEELELEIVQGPTGSSQNGGEVDPVEGDGTGWISGIATDAEVIDLKDKLLGGDQLDGEGVHFGGSGPGVGDHGFQTSQGGGATTWGEDHADTQFSGPEERNNQHEFKPEAEQKDDGSDQDSSGSAIKVVAVQNEASQALREAIEKKGGLEQDKAIDPDKLETIHAKEAAPGAPSPAKGDFADLIAATQKPFEFLPAKPTSPDLSTKLLHAAEIDLAGPGMDLHLETEMFTASPVAVENYHTLAQPLFDVEFA